MQSRAAGQQRHSAGGEVAPPLNSFYTARETPNAPQSQSAEHKPGQDAGTDQSSNGERSPLAEQRSSSATAGSQADGGVVADEDGPLELPEEPQYYGFFSHAVAKKRRGFLKPLLMFFSLTTIILWATLSIFWGSAINLEAYFPKLQIQVIDFDSAASGSNAIVGPYVTAMLNTFSESSGPHLTYTNTPTTDYPGGLPQIMQAVKHSGPWASVVIFGNATSSWREALETGTSYDPTGSVGIYFSSARFYQITLDFLVALLNENLHEATYSASQAASQQFFCGNTNATSYTTAAIAPGTIGTAFGSFAYDVAPITVWASAAPMEAGLIYLTIFTFHWAILTFFGRMFSGLNNRLKFWHLFAMRMTFTTTMFFFLALWYTLVNQAFQEPLESGPLGHAGFFVFWMLNWVTLGAVGLAMESMVSLLGPKFFPFFLIFWIITNLTSSFLPLQLMDNFYRWGWGWPFLQNVQATKIILYGTEPNEFLGRYFGILLAWTCFNIVFLCFTMYVERRRNDANMVKAGQQKRLQEKEEHENKSA